MLLFSLSFNLVLLFVMLKTAYRNAWFKEINDKLVEQNTYLLNDLQEMPLIKAKLSDLQFDHNALKSEYENLKRS